MKLSLDSDLLPKTHAIGGDADIIYEYDKSNFYPKHCLLIEATLSDGNNQRRMEMEPVSRHLGEHVLKTKNLFSYSMFITNDLNINVISDFRSRKDTIYYDRQNFDNYIKGMKIIPLQSSELKKIIKSSKKYKELYKIFEEAFKSNLPPHEWYKTMVADIL
ncbi:AlwI family type II restriction endonuclease [bacterium]|nr:AlwI family type II restriction endonuclease [bacterium]